MNPLNWLKTIRAWELFTREESKVSVHTNYSGPVIGRVLIDVETGKIVDGKPKPKDTRSSFQKKLDDNPELAKRAEWVESKVREATREIIESDERARRENPFEHSPIL